jgi:hypothetical protein
MRENIGRYCEWVDAGGVKRDGYIAEFIPKGTRIPDWYIKGQANPKGVRFRTHQYVSKRDDRYLIDCGMHRLTEDITDVVYRLVSVTWKNLLIL